MKPTELDGRPVVVTSPATPGLHPWFTGAGDDIENSSRGTGQRIRIDWAADETGMKTVVLQFLEPLEIHDGHIFSLPVENWSPDSEWQFCIVMPATIATPNVGGTGNANLSLVEVGVNMILPADGDGTHDVDLDQAVPVWAGMGGGGFWDVLDHRSGNVTVGTVFSESPVGGDSLWHLFDVEKKSFFLRSMPFGNPQGIFNLDTLHSEWLSERWSLRMDVTRHVNDSINAPSQIAGWLLFFREFTV